MTNLFGGTRVGYLDLFNAHGTWLLLGACAKTLESLRLYPTDFYGEVLSLYKVWVFADHLTVIYRSLELTASHIDVQLSGDPIKISAPTNPYEVQATEPETRTRKPANE